MADLNKKNNNRRYPGIKGIRPDSKEIKRSEANERKTAWAALSSKEQLEILDRRLGAGVGAKRQRARLQAVIAQDDSKKAIETELARRKDKKNEQ